MRYIKRLNKPLILENNAKEWTQKLLDSDNKRPDNSKYRHKKIKEQLSAMSYNKCFYCERPLIDCECDIDHFIEVSERPDLAYEWENLYLSCKNCNDKADNKSISVSDALDPCRNTDEEIQTHILFENNIVASKNNSQLGLNTIKKFKLNSEKLCLIRSNALIEFNNYLISIYKNMINDKRLIMCEEEIEILHKFKNQDRPFSLMFKILLEKHNL